MAATRRGTRLNTLDWDDGNPERPAVLRRHGLRRTRVQTLDDVREPHALLRHRRRWVAVSTFTNTIVWVNDDGSLARRWTAPGEGDAWHINSLTTAHGRLVASAFGRFATHRGWNEGDVRLGSGIVFDVETGEDLLSGLSCPHDPVFDGGSWWVCNSARGEVLQLTPSGEVHARLGVGGWTRGLVVTRDSIYVGTSAHRLAGTTGRARVLKLDRTTHQELASWELPCPEVFALAWASPLLTRALLRRRRPDE